ncbi:ABC transporter ATPase [Mucilaginibacter sp. RS28]|uniref:ABC transporter ATPase n=1 Tax=Mucilaginibacter straminoryzae TaxID=2932774 RepID=A0A9X2B7M0_9SPHI|nr:ABC transporter ATPase [Mucilaginibacter straminoryzae]MCJ8208709.1 ABC transporter ATPase [Mucilaginibacter straminoryzae]
MQFSENSRVWIYQSDRELNQAEVSQLQQQLDNFCYNWTAHNHQLKAGAEIRYNRFIILMVDESQAGASGCSIDKSVRFLKDIEQQFGIDLFDRFNLAYKAGDKVLSAPRAVFEELIKQGKINLDTIVFNNVVQNVAELKAKWEVPFKNSWHAQMFGNLVTA